MGRSPATWSPAQAAEARKLAAAGRARRAKERAELAAAAADALRDPSAAAHARVAQLIATATSLCAHELGTLRGERLARQIASLSDALSALCGRARTQSAAPVRTPAPETPDAPAGVA